MTWQSSQSTFQSSKLILLVNNYMCICAVALTTPKFNLTLINLNSTNQIRALKCTPVLHVDFVGLCNSNLATFPGFCSVCWLENGLEFCIDITARAWENRLHVTVGAILFDNALMLLRERMGYERMSSACTRLSLSQWVWLHKTTMTCRELYHLQYCQTAILGNVPLDQHSFMVV